MNYAHTNHLMERMAERNITAEEILCALGRGSIRIIDAALASFYDVASGLVVLVNVEYRRVVTAWRV